MLRINGRLRLTESEIEKLKTESGITELQYRIIKRRYYDWDQPSVTKVCIELSLSPRTYNRELRKAAEQIEYYTNKPREP